jgi:hypothetical protein
LNKENTSCPFHAIGCGLTSSIIVNRANPCDSISPENPNCSKIAQFQVVSGRFGPFSRENVNLGVLVLKWELWADFADLASCVGAKNGPKNGQKSTIFPGGGVGVCPLSCADLRLHPPKRLCVVQVDGIPAILISHFD